MTSYAKKIESADMPSVVSLQAKLDATVEAEKRKADADAKAMEENDAQKLSISISTLRFRRAAVEMGLLESEDGGELKKDICVRKKETGCF